MGDEMRESDDVASVLNRSFEPGHVEIRKRKRTEERE